MYISNKFTMTSEVDPEIKPADNASDVNDDTADSCLSLQENFNIEDTWLQPNWVLYGYRSFLTSFISSFDLFQFQFNDYHRIK